MYSGVLIKNDIRGESATLHSIIFQQKYQFLPIISLNMFLFSRVARALRTSATDHADAMNNIRNYNTDLGVGVEGFLRFSITVFFFFTFPSGVTDLNVKQVTAAIIDRDIFGAPFHC